MLSPAVVCRKKRMVSTPNRTCHQAPRFSELPLSSSLNETSCHPFTPRTFHSLVPSPDPVVISGFGEIMITRNNVRRAKSLVSLFENYVEVLR